MALGTYVVAPAGVISQLPDGMARELLFIELRQAFSPKPEGGWSRAAPLRTGLMLLADGYSPGAVQWLLRDASIAACVDAL